MAIKTITPKYKISHVLDDDLQVSQVACAYLPKPKQEHSLRHKNFNVGINTFCWMDAKGKSCVNVDYA